MCCYEACCAKLVATLRLLRDARDVSREVCGVLVYPRVTRTLRERDIRQGHAMEIFTVDLNADWSQIKEEMRVLFR